MAKFIVPNHSFCNCMKHFQILEENELFVPSDDDDDDWSCFQKIWNKLKVRNFRTSFCKFEWFADVTFHKRAKGWHKCVLIKGLWRSHAVSQRSLNVWGGLLFLDIFSILAYVLFHKILNKPGLENGEVDSEIKGLPEWALPFLSDG